jgi:hypothetical protein
VLVGLKTVSLTDEYGSETKRHIVGYAGTWQSLAPGITDSGDRCWNVLWPTTFGTQEDLNRAARNKEIRLVTTHLDEPAWGFWGSLQHRLAGVAALGVPDDGACFRLVEELFHSGELTHLSQQADVETAVKRSARGPNNLPVYGIMSARLVEIGPIGGEDDAADPAAVIESAGGRQAEWRNLMHRQQVMNNLRDTPRIRSEDR